MSGGPPEICCVWLEFGFVSSFSHWGVLVCEPVRKAEILPAYFDGKQSRDPVDLPCTCHPSPSLTTYAFRSWEVRRFLLDPESYGGTDPLAVFLLFSTCWLCFAVVFRLLLLWGSFPVFWRVFNVTRNLKGPPSSSVANYRPISLTRIRPRLSSIWCQFIFRVLWNAVVCFQNSLIGKVLALVMPFCV